MKHENEHKLYQIAEDQGGYFHLSQAREIGLNHQQIYREVKRGRIEQHGGGLFRFSLFPNQKHDEIHASLVKAGKRAVVGFESALSVYDLSDLIPAEIHLILPRKSSRRRPGIRMHTVKLAPEDITNYEGFRITTVARTIADIVFSHTEKDQVSLAIRQSIERGMTTDQEILQQAEKRTKRVYSEIANLLEAINYEV